MSHLPQYRPSVILQATCLKPNYSLQRQLLVSFGATSVLSIVAVLVLAISAAHHAGETVKDQAHDSIRDQVLTNIQHKSMHIADIMTSKLANLEATAALLAEITRDRIVGYPNQGYELDTHVPFYDASQGRNIYPLQGDPLPLNWNITLNVNDSNDMEHAQERWPWYNRTPLSTVAASYTFQGTCDPSAKRNGSYYLENCTDANNNITTGGVFRPTPTNKFLYEKSSELGLFLKPLWESAQDVFTIGFYFANSGAGSLTAFPPRYTTAPGKYISIGCDWMQAINNFTGKPLATPEEIKRCHPVGTLVRQVEYNPLERPWCRQQALNPNQTITYGPYLNAGQGLLWLVTIGRAVFDRRTGEFIACTLVDVAIEELVDVIHHIATAGRSFSTVSLVDWDDGTVVAGPFWDARTANQTIQITSTGLIDQKHFDQIRSLLNFSQPWDPDVVRNVQVVDHGDSSVVTAYPVPVPPKKYDPAYSPKYMVLFRVDDAVFQPIRRIQNSIDEDVAIFTRQTIFVGVAFGFILVLLVIWLFVRVLTRPLRWMQSVAWGIVNHTDERVTAEDLLDNWSDQREWCTPKTEITALVSEFRMMIRGFSREGAATVAPSVLHEIPNRINWKKEFFQLYTRESRRSSFMESESQSSLTAVARKSSVVESARTAAAVVEMMETVDESLECIESDENSLDGAVSPPPRHNKEHSLPLPVTLEENQLRRYLKNDLSIDRIRVYRSPLFWWVLVSFIMPLTICYTIVYILGRNQVIHILPTWLASAETVSLDIQVDTVTSAASLRAELIETVMNGVTRDLHLLTRFAGWLLFDAIRRSTGFTELTQATEECKNFSVVNKTCPFLREDNRAPCDCAWNDGHDRICTNFGANDTRYFQKRFFAAQSKGADPLTGDRNFTVASIRPEDTEWWHNTTTIPGNRKGKSASGYATTYDRVRVTSALAVVEFPIYNYPGTLGPGTLGRQTTNLGTFTAFQADGLMTGYDGCQYGFAQYAHFQSSNLNLAFEIGGLDLCPLNSYGFDPRCCDWFAIGKNVTTQSRVALYVAPPSDLFEGQTVASTSTSPLIDPRNQQFVGQTIVQFSNHALVSAIETSDVDFAFLITPMSTFSGGDTVVASGQTTTASLPIREVVLRFDPLVNSSNQLAFDVIISEMKAGVSGNRTFNRTKSDGTLEASLLVYTPVKLRSLRAIRPDDFSRGINASQTLLYSLAVASEWKDINSSFKKIEAAVLASLERKGWAYTISICSIFVAICAFTSLIAISVTKPVIILLRAVRNINAGRIEHDIPPMQGGSREVNQVYNSFAKLYKIVRFSNSAFFSGDMNRAFHFISDALDLFRKFDDRKAIGIASNNLGNTLLAIYREKGSKSLPKERCCQLLGGKCVFRAAKQHMDEAVRIATLDFDQAVANETKAKYAEQLANRHFNRAMICLLTKQDPCSSDSDLEQGYKDLLRAKQLDCDVRDFWMARMLVLKNSDAYFNRLIRRIRGLVDLNDDEMVGTIWNAKELVDETDRLLFAAWDEFEAPIFSQVSRVGRLQQLEEATIGLELALSNTVEAARLGMRMFVEDEFLIESAFASAATAVLSFAVSSGWTSRTMAAFKHELRTMTKACKNSPLDLGRSFVFCFDLSDSYLEHATSVRADVHSSLLNVFDRYCRDEDCVGLVHINGGEDLGFALECNRDGRPEQRRRFHSATLMTSNSSFTFPLAVQMASASILQCTEIPIFLIAFIDGYTWDANAFGRVHDQLCRLQRQGKSEIHVIIVGFELPEHVEEQCNVLGKLSRTSAYIRADTESIHQAFEQVAALMSAGRGLATESIHGGITMEKF